MAAWIFLRTSSLFSFKLMNAKINQVYNDAFPNFKIPVSPTDNGGLIVYHFKNSVLDKFLHIVEFLIILNIRYESHDSIPHLTISKFQVVNVTFPSNTCRCLRKYFF